MLNPKKKSEKSRVETVPFLRAMLLFSNAAHMGVPGTVCACVCAWVCVCVWKVNGIWKSLKIAVSCCSFSTATMRGVLITAMHS